MKCSGFEPLLALYAGGDLAQDEAGRVETHLGECADCRAALAVFESAQAGLRGLAEETVDGVVYSRLRARVLDEIGRQRRFAWRAWMLAAAAALVIGIGTLALLRRTTPAVAPPVAGSAPREVVARAEPAAPLAAPKVAVPRAAPRPKPVAPKPAETESLVVKLVTDDPDVVIYWIVGSNGDAL